jgi:predicted pyridoxine 5'-phosphate oxidase superfamily flavin-nucleotide-binding protein
MRVIRDRPRSVDVDEFLARPLFAHLATASDHGPRESPVWFLWEDAAMWIICSPRADSFPTRIERDPRCAIGVVDFDRSTGLVQHVGLRGHASVEPFDVARAARLLARYLGRGESTWDARFRATLRKTDDQALIRFLPETVVARDQSYELRDGSVI